MECFDVHVVPEACDIVTKSATIVAILESDSKTAKRPSPLAQGRFDKMPKPARWKRALPRHYAFA
jgi:hypothetical protein